MEDVVHQGEYHESTKYVNVRPTIARLRTTVQKLTVHDISILNIKQWILNSTDIRYIRYSLAETWKREASTYEIDHKTIDKTLQTIEPKSIT